LVGDTSLREVDMGKIPRVFKHLIDSTLRKSYRCTRGLRVVVVDPIRWTRGRMFIR
jgi:hypothetical protein